MKKTLLYLAAGVAIGYYLLSMKKSSSNASAAADELPKGANPEALGLNGNAVLGYPPGHGDTTGRSGMDMADPQFSGFVY
jgi:hypothetical protein